VTSEEAPPDDERPLAAETLALLGAKAAPLSRSLS
jgi:hypothetical protein